MTRSGVKALALVAGSVVGIVGAAQYAQWANAAPAPDLPVHARNAAEQGWPHPITPREVREVSEWTAREILTDESYYSGTASCAGVRPGLYVCGLDYSRSARPGAGRYRYRVLVRVWEDGSAFMPIPGPAWQGRRIRTTTVRVTVVVVNGRVIGGVA